MKGKILYLLIATPLLAFQVSGQQALSLKEAVDYSLTNHASVSVYENEVLIADMKGIEALSGYLPQINGTASIDDNLKRQTSILPGVIFGRPNENIPVQFGTQYNSNANVQLDQTIYDQSLITGLKANKPNQEMSEFRLHQNEEELIYKTMSSYYQVQIFREQVNLLAENEKKINDILKIQKIQYELGVIKKVDYDRIRVNLNNILSQKKVATTNYETAINSLKVAMGMPLTTALIIKDSIPAEGKTTEFPASSAYDIHNRLDFKVAERSLRLYEIDFKRKKAGLLPTVSAYFRYGTNAFGNDFVKSYNKSFNYSSIGIRANIPIFSGFRRLSQIKQAQLTFKNAETNLKLNEQNMQLQVENSNTRLINTYSNLQNNKENLTLAKDVFDNTSLQYEKGVATLSDFINADYSYKEAQSNYISSLLNYLIARIELEKSKGTLKDYASQL